jgi:hypothetical protein
MASTQAAFSTFPAPAQKPETKSDLEAPLDEAN